MFIFAFLRPRFAEWRGWLPPLALTLAMFAVLAALGGDRGHLHRPSMLHNQLTAKTLSIAENLSYEHNFRMASRIWRNDDGGFEYKMYGRFPIGGFALVKLATAPFGDDLAAKLLAARVLALAAFCGAAALVYLSIARIAGRRWIALAATLLGFSGLNALYFSDAVSVEASADMFGAALVFHGMVAFVLDGRFRQLLVKVCVALFLGGWHVYALLLPFIALGLGGEAVALARAAAAASSDRAKAARRALGALIRSRYAVLAAAAVLFGSALLALNFANEYNVSLIDERSSTLYSAMRRLGLTSMYDANPDLAWDAFARRQLHRAGVAVMPYGVVRAVGYDLPPEEPLMDAGAPAVLGAAATAAALAAIALVPGRLRLLAASAVLFGFCWTLPVRHNAYDYQHVYEGLWYTALALALFTLALVGARRWLGGRFGGVLAVGAVVLAATAFALSAFHAGRMQQLDARQTQLAKTALADFSAIRETTRGKRVRVVRPARESLDSAAIAVYYQHMNYYLAGSYFAHKSPEVCDPLGADYTLSHYRDDSSAYLLTPDNSIAFLYEKPAERCRETRRRLESSEPAARSVYDVYLEDVRLRHLKADCAAADHEARFFARAYAADPDDLPENYREHGYEPRYGWFGNHGLSFDGACLMTLHMPRYEIARIETGQQAADGEYLWSVSIIVPPSAETLARYEGAYQAVRSSGEPAARSGFDLYLDGGALYYLKEPCAESDARGRFFLSVHPADADDLPPERRALGHDSLNFDFEPPAGAVFNGKCMAARELPDYGIARIETGQDAPGGGRLWTAEIAFGE